MKAGLKCSAYISLLVLQLMTVKSFASELVYSPINPSFGGNPLNGSYLLGLAQSQNDTSAPSSDFSSPSASQTTELDRFTASLQSRLLSRLLSNIGSENFNTGSLETQDFIVSVEQGDDGSLMVVTEDKNTGESTQINVGGIVQ